MVTGLEDSKYLYERVQGGVWLHPIHYTNNDDNMPKITKTGPNNSRSAYDRWCKKLTIECPVGHGSHLSPT